MSKLKINPTTGALDMERSDQEISNVIDDYFNGPPSVEMSQTEYAATYAPMTPGGVYICQTFTTVDAFDLVSVTVAMREQVASTGVLDLQIWGTNAGVPDNTKVLGSAIPFDVAPLDSNTNPVPFAFASAVPLEAVTQYAIVVLGDNLLTGVLFPGANNSNPYAGGQVGNAASPGNLVAWSMSASFDLFFEIEKAAEGKVNLSNLKDVSPALPSIGDSLKYNGTRWAPGSVTIPNVEAGTRVVIGDSAGSGATDLGSGDTVIGYQAGLASKFKVGGGSNVIIGRLAGRSTGSITRLEHSIIMGQNSAYLANVKDTIIMGNSAGQSSTSNSSLAIGSGSGSQVNGNYHVALGFNAGKGIGEPSALCHNVVSIGANTGGSAGGDSRDSVSESIFIGSTTGFQSGGLSQILMGKDAGRTSVGDNKIAIGQDAGKNSDADNCTYLGHGAGIGNTLAGQFVINNSRLPSYADRTAAVTAITVLNGAIAGNTYLYFNETTFIVEAVRL